MAEYTRRGNMKYKKILPESKWLKDKLQEYPEKSGLSEIFIDQRKLNIMDDFHSELIQDNSVSPKPIFFEDMILFLIDRFKDDDYITVKKSDLMVILEEYTELMYGDECEFGGTFNPIDYALEYNYCPEYYRLRNSIIKTLNFTETLLLKL